MAGLMRRRRHPLMAAALAAVLALTGACGDSSSSASRTDATPTTPTTTPSQPVAPGCGVTSVGFSPLNDLAGGTYRDQPGGLYPGRTNSHPDQAAGVALARAIQPRSTAGAPDPNGKYALVSIGMSNTTMEFGAFKAIADREAGKDPALAIVDGAQGGQTAALWASPACACWGVLDSRLQAAGVGAAQVAVVWLKEADAGPTSGWPAYAATLKSEMETMLQLLKQRFPNLEIAYLSSRIYAGYATSTLNPEPYAYESAFSVRGVIQDQLNGQGGIDYRTGQAPWVAWGPYLWADGVRPRSDGLTWACSELSSSDGTHPSTTGQQKVASMLLEFVRSDATAREWFLR
jgi:lysophospholipase L1-like esterase